MLKFSLNLVRAAGVTFEGSKWLTLLTSLVWEFEFCMVHVAFQICAEWCIFVLNSTSSMCCRCCTSFYYTLYFCHYWPGLKIEGELKEEGYLCSSSLKLVCAVGVTFEGVGCICLRTELLWELKICMSHVAFYICAEWCIFFMKSMSLCVVDVVCCCLFPLCAFAITEWWFKFDGKEEGLCVPNFSYPGLWSWVAGAHFWKAFDNFNSVQDCRGGVRSLHGACRISDLYRMMHFCFEIHLSCVW